jgi:hypothetical protein
LVLQVSTFLVRPLRGLPERSFALNEKDPLRAQEVWRSAGASNDDAPRNARS